MFQWSSTADAVNIKFPDRASVGTDWAFVVKIRPTGEDVWLV